MQSIHTRKQPATGRDEVLIYATPWMKRENSMLSDSTMKPDTKGHIYDSTYMKYPD